MQKNSVEIEMREYFEEIWTKNENIYEIYELEYRFIA